MKETLQNRKRRLVHDAIYDAAIDLFFERGFEATTVEEIADAAGVSRRSFFRYFASKDDLLAQSIVDYGKALCVSIESCPASASPLEVLEHAVLDGVRYVEVQPRIHRTVEIATRSHGARQAYSSRLADVDEMLSQAYATRFQISSVNNSTARLMAGFTSLLMNASILSWFSKEHDDLSASVKQVVANAIRIFSNSALVLPPPRPAASSKKKAAAPGRRRK